MPFQTQTFKNNIFYWMVLGWLCGGCSAAYGPPMLVSQEPYMPKPAYNGDSKSKLYANVEMAYHASSNDPKDSADELGHLSAGISQGTTTSLANFSYGLYGFGGYHSVNRISPKEEKAFFGLKGNGSMNFRTSFEGFEWRFVGIEGALSQEFGPYKQFREQHRDTLRTIAKSGVKAIALTSELLTPLENDNYTTLKWESGIKISKNQEIYTENQAVYSEVTMAVKTDVLLFSFSAVYSIGPHGEYCGGSFDFDCPLGSAWWGLNAGLQYSF